MKPSQSALETIKRYLPSDSIDLFCQGLEEFNRGQYYDCHETLEAVWQKQIGKEREMTQGIIQIAVALYHLERENEVGAIKLLERGLCRLERFEDSPVGLRISDLTKTARELLGRIKNKTFASADRKIHLEIAFF